jgi:hypothetical protein
MIPVFNSKLSLRIRWVRGKLATLGRKDPNSFTWRAVGSSKELGGNDSYKSEHALDVAWCGAYINGVFDTHGVFDYYGQERKFCNPVGISLRELTDIVVPYLRNHPNERNKIGAYLVEVALKERFPCN